MESPHSVQMIRRNCCFFVSFRGKNLAESTLTDIFETHKLILSTMITSSSPPTSFANQESSIYFSNLSFEVNKKTILNKVSGGCLKGEFLAIMGSTGSGKTTLLDTIAGRKIARGGKVVDGKVFINSFEVSRNDRTKKIGFVSQEDSLHGGFTVRETFFFSARLRYGYRVPRQEIELKVNNMLQLLGLQVCADVRIGNVLLRGISGGQKRRVSIGVELLVQYEILCLDEPTSGLDSIAAYSIIEELKSLSSKGMAILSTIHQPSSAIFQMFDKLLLMSAGRVVYFGPAKDVLNYFDAVLHIPCPDFFNPGDFVIDVISESFSQTGQKIPAEELEVTFNSSKYKQDMIQTFERGGG